ncbi:MAG TPA: phosphatase [Selenomonas sp.]|nr:phosphatase [Selenomonas sp.]
MYAVVDVGSNTVRLNIYKIEYGQPVPVLSRKESVGLASYVRNGQMLPAGIQRVTEVLSSFKVLLDGLKISNVHVFATAALRNAKNSRAAVGEIIKNSGMDVHVISGEMEAELDFIGASHALENMDSGILVDIGGGSTELVPYKDGKMLNAVSLPFGSLNTYDKFVANILPTAKERKAIKKAVTEALKKLPDEFAKGSYPVICGVGGTARAANKLAVDMFRLPAEETSINVINLGKMIKILENDEKDSVPVDALDILVRVIPYRVRTILPGMIVLQTIAKYFGGETIEVTEAGVREGYLYKFVVNGEVEAETPQSGGKTGKTGRGRRSKRAEKAEEKKPRARRTRRKAEATSEEPQPQAQEVVMQEVVTENEGTEA